MCGVQLVIEPAKVELAVSAPLRSAQSRGPLDLVGLRSAPVGPGRGPPDLVGLRSAPVGPGRGPPDLVGLRSASVGSKPRSTGPREPSAPERCVQSDKGHRFNTLRQTKISFHKCGSLFLVVATRFELATSASRTQRSTKLSHATIH